MTTYGFPSQLHQTGTHSFLPWQILSTALASGEQAKDPPHRSNRRNELNTTPRGRRDAMWRTFPEKRNTLCSKLGMQNSLYARKESCSGEKRAV